MLWHCYLASCIHEGCYICSLLTTNDPHQSQFGSEPDHQIWREFGTKPEGKNFIRFDTIQRHSMLFNGS